MSQLNFLRKSLLLLLILGVILAFNAPEPNTYTLKEKTALEGYQAIEVAKKYLVTSQIPAVDLLSVNKALDSLQISIASQYNKFHPQPKQKADSLKSKN